MTRLRHSTGGFIRSLQISSAQVFAFVEGGLDRPFYDRVVGSLSRSRQLKHQVIAVRELQGSTGGKPALLGLFEGFRKDRRLSMIAFGKPMVCVFFADKDSDDITRKKLRSAHLFYTSTYDLEGHLYSCGDLSRAIADACGLTYGQAAQLLSDQGNWLKERVQHWKPWIALCLISQVKRVRSSCTYDRPSAVNPQPLQPHDPVLLEQYKKTLASAVSISRSDFNDLYKKFEKSIEKSINEGNPLRYFKGKWLGHLLQKYIEQSPRIPDTLTSSAGEKVITALIAQVATHSECKCCGTFSHGITELLKQIR